jgi:hypothetical protein
VNLDEPAQLHECPYCGETVDVVVEPVGARHEEYVEDCSVCCRPWKVVIERDEDATTVSLRRDDD